METIGTFWAENDNVIRILLVAVVFVVAAAMEKLYVFIRYARSLARVREAESLEELAALPCSILSRFFGDVHKYRNADRSRLDDLVGVKLELVEGELMRFVPFLGLVATLAPMVGLVGTFLGVWHVFEGVGSFGLEEPAVIAQGIKEVLIDTVAGLTVAIPAMILYKSFQITGNRLLLRLEERTYELLEANQ